MLYLGVDTTMCPQLGFHNGKPGQPICPSASTFDGSRKMSESPDFPISGPSHDIVRFYPA